MSAESRLSRRIFFKIITGLGLAALLNTESSFNCAKIVYADNSNDNQNPENDLPIGPNRTFHKDIIAQGFDESTDFTISLDGRIFVLEKDGEVKVIKNGVVLPHSALSLAVNNISECGLLGITLDPKFEINNQLYLYYVNEDPYRIRLSRFTFVGNLIDKNSEFILLESKLEPTYSHVAGGINFGPDGKLWIAVGDNGKGENAQDLSNIFGKILRINRDGSIPKDNPLVGQVGMNEEIWAYGFRNPFRFNFLPDGRPILGDVGSDKNEEINIVEKGENYGWPYAEGFCDCSYHNPVFAYPHGPIATAIIGGVLDQNHYIYADVMRQQLKQLTVDSQYNFSNDEIIDDVDTGLIVSIKKYYNQLYYLSYYSQTTQSGTLYTFTP